MLAVTDDATVEPLVAALALPADWFEFTVRRSHGRILIEVYADSGVADASYGALEG